MDALHSPVVRFAPSPTGLLHVGNARGALINWLHARRHGGRVVLRIDDTDRARSTEAYVEAIYRDLAWLGLVPDLVVRQSARAAEHHAAFTRLRATGRLYPCWETPEELETRRRLALARGRPPVYDRAALKLGEQDQARLAVERGPPYWRFKLSDQPVVWDDIIQGFKRFPPGSLSDPVVVKAAVGDAPGEPLYGFASVVDDIDLGITDVVRGEDHVANTAVQIDLFEALGAAPPRFAHFSLITDAAGQGLSKRTGAMALADLRARGIEPGALRALLATLGTGHRPEPEADLDALARGFDLDRMGRAPPRFDPADLDRLSADLVRRLPFATVADRLPAGATEAFWLAVRGNLDRVADAADWWAVVAGPVTPGLIGDPVLAAADEALPPEPWTVETWGDWTRAVRARTGLKGRDLFMPLRLALTGQAHGPELAALLPLIGRTRARRRLAGEAA